MPTVSRFFKQLFSTFLAFIIFSTLLLYVSPTIAEELRLTPEASGVIDEFSNKFCGSISLGLSVDDASRGSIKGMIRGLISSGLLKEFMSAPKSDLASLVSAEIFDRCGESLPLSKEGLNDYINSLADGRTNEMQPKPFKPFGIG